MWIILSFLINLIVFLVFVLIVYLLFRPINLWYWRVSERIENQERQIDLLEKLVRNSNIEQITSNGKPLIFNDSVVELTDIQKMSLKYRKSKLKDGEIVVFNKVADKIEIIKSTQWQEIIDNEIQNNYCLL